MCPDKVQILYTVPLFWSGEGACSWPKNTTRSDMINTAFVLAVLGVITLNVAVIHLFSLADISLVRINLDSFILLHTFNPWLTSFLPEMSKMNFWSELVNILFPRNISVCFAFITIISNNISDVLLFVFPSQMCLDVLQCTTTMRATQTRSIAMKVILIFYFIFDFSCNLLSHFVPLKAFLLIWIIVCQPLTLACVQYAPLQCFIYTESSLVKALWLTSTECPCFHWLTSSVSMFLLAEALASPLPQESLNKQNSWKKHTSAPAKRKSILHFSPIVCCSILNLKSCSSIVFNIYEL